MSTTLVSEPMGTLDRLKAAAKVLITGTVENKTLSEPKDPSRAALVSELTKWCIDERLFWKPVHDRIREEQKYAGGKQWPTNYTTQSDNQEPYVGDVIQQLVNRKTAGLYAKDPTPEAVIVERLDFTVWDGNQETIDAAKAILEQFEAVKPAADALPAEAKAQLPPPPPQVDQAKEILADYQLGMDGGEDPETGEQIIGRTVLKKVAETATKLIQNQWDSQSPKFMVMAKQAVTRIITSRVAFIKVMYRRDVESIPTESANTMDFADKLASLQAQLQAIEKNLIGADDAAVEQIRLLKDNVEKEIAQYSTPEQAFKNEGIVLDWLGATSVIVDRHCTNLIEFVGAHRIAHEMLMTVEQCEAKFKCSLRDSGAKIYASDGQDYITQDAASEDSEDPDKFRKQKVCVWHIEDKDSGLQYVVCDGVKEFLKEPGPNEPEVNRFWSIVAITFNRQEISVNKPHDDVTCYPRSDVRLAMPMQQDMNTAGEGMREHRVANRPAWIGVKAKFAATPGGESDLDKLSRPRKAHTVLMLEVLNPGEKIGDYIQQLPHQEIDEKMYETGTSSQAMMLATGQQPSDIGSQRPDEKATGQNIAAQARATSEGSNIDDLNFGFSTIAQMTWEMLIQEMPEKTVKKKVGRGAVWPEVNREEIAQCIFFQIEAGSMGRPNALTEQQNFVSIAPQLGGLMKDAGKSLEPLIKEGVRRLDDKLDVDEFLKPAQLTAPPVEQPAPQAPPSVSISANLADLAPEEQDQAVQKFYGLQPAPAASRILNKVGHGPAVNAAHANTLHAQGGQPAGGQPEPKPPTPPAP